MSNWCVFLFLSKLHWHLDFIGLSQLDLNTAHKQDPLPRVKGQAPTVDEPEILTRMMRPSGSKYTLESLSCVIQFTRSRLRL